MKVRHFISYTITLLICLPNLVLSQDTVFITGNRYLVCNVISIDDFTVSYQKENIPGSAIFTLDKSMVKEVKFQEGTIEIVQGKGMNTPEGMEILQAKESIKLHPLSMLNSHLAFSYERQLKDKRNLDVSLGIVHSKLSLPGMPGGWYGKLIGGFITGGVKFLLRRSYFRNSLTFGDLQRGFFLMPEIGVSMYNVTNLAHTYYDSLTSSTDLQITNMTASSVALIASLGHQFILFNRLTIGYQAGVGISFDNYSYSNPNFISPGRGDNLTSEFTEHVYSHWSNESGPFAAKFKITIGYLYY